MGKYKILAIDDDVDFLASTQLFLESHDFEVKTAINTKIGLDTLKLFHPDLIILDIIMDTKLEGFNFLNELKSDINTKKIPIIMNSSMADVLGVNMRSAIEDVEHLPKTRFVDKSGNYKELIKSINELLPS